jgi:hypothetical protein
MQITNLIDSKSKKPFVAIRPEAGDTVKSLLTAAHKFPGNVGIITVDFGCGPTLSLIEVHPN